MEDAIAFLKETGITGAARAAVTSLLGSVREAHKTPPALEVTSEAVISKVSDAWGKLVLQPPGAHAQRAAAQLDLTRRLIQGQHTWGKLVLQAPAVHAHLLQSDSADSMLLVCVASLLGVQVHRVHQRILATWNVFWRDSAGVWGVY